MVVLVVIVAGGDECDGGGVGGGFCFGGDVGVGNGGCANYFDKVCYLCVTPYLRITWSAAPVEII